MLCSHQNLSKIRRRFARNFTHWTCKISWKSAKFHKIERNFAQGFEKSKKQNFEEAKYQRKFALKGTKYQRNFAKIEEAKFRTSEISVKIRAHWNKTAVKFRKTATLGVIFGQSVPIEEKIY